MYGIERFLRFMAAWTWTLVLSGLSVVLGMLTGMWGLTVGWLLLCRPWARGTLRIVRCGLEIQGREHLVGPAIFACNHQSFVDVVFMPAMLPRRTKWVAKRELSRVPLWGWAFKAGGVFVDRKRPQEAIERLRGEVEGLPADWSICIFPEGTRSPDGRVHRFKRGLGQLALQARLPIVPIGFWGAQELMPLGSLMPDPGTIQVTAGPRISTDHWREETIEEHLEEVRAVIGTLAEASRARFYAARAEAPHDAPDLAHQSP